MGPTNVILDYTEGCTVGIIDWEVTGFVPKAWIRTKFLGLLGVWTLIFLAMTWTRIRIGDNGSSFSSRRKVSLKRQMRGKRSI